MRWFTAFIIAALLSPATGLASAGPAHQPMLASVYRGEAQLSEYWVSEKLDGVRGHWDGASLWTRGGYRIATPGWFTASWPDRPMDGELWIGRERFDEVSALVRRATVDDQAWHAVKFMVFDLPAHGGTFTERVQMMRSLSDPANPTLKVIAQLRVADAAALDQLLADTVAAGGEGLMLHHGGARYLAGRSGDLLKYKQYDDAEAWVVGYTEGNGKYTGQVGSLIVRDDEGRRFRLGSGLSDAQRQEPPAMGSRVTYRYNGLTSSGLPRFARFIRVRDDEPDTASQPDPFIPESTP